jgi:hypothetical protein
VFRWLIGGLLVCWMGFLLIVVPLNQLLYGWDWKANATGMVALVVFVGGIGFLRGREWGRRVLITAMCAALVLLTVAGARSIAHDRDLTSIAVGVLLSVLMLAGLSLPSAKGTSTTKSQAAEQ